MSSRYSMPIALDLSRRSETMVKVVLSHAVSLDEEDNIHVLRICGSDEKVLVPPKCLDTLRILIHQFRMYQQLVRKLIDLPETSQTTNAINMYIAITSYLAHVVTAFYKEVNTEKSLSTTKWRSVYLDYHLAMAMHNSAFTKEQQATALKEMKRTWAQFKEKRRYPKVQDMSAKQLHEKFCSDGHNMCGGPFEHAMSVDEMVAMMLNMVTGMAPPPPPPSSAVRDVAQSPEGEPSSSNRTEVASTSERLAEDKELLRASADTSLDVEMLSPTKQTTSRSKRTKKDARRKQSQPAETGGKRQNESADDTVESPIQALASIFESHEDAKRKPKGQRATRPRTGSKASGKKKASSPAKNAVVAEGDNVDDDDMLLVNDSFVETLNATSTSKRSQGPAKQKALGKKKVAFSEEAWSDRDDDVVAAVEDSVRESLSPEISIGAEVDQYDETSQWPSCLDDWEDWPRLAFESGNSRVFLKLAGWMLLRYRQLAHIDMDADVDGLIIPDNPRLRTNLAKDEFYEALGMERLYSAIVHMDTRPRYLIHLFHALGKTIAESDIGESHPTVWPIIPPPVVAAHNVEDMDVPWIHLQDPARDRATNAIEEVEDDDVDAIGSPDLDVGALSLTDDLGPAMHVDSRAGSLAERVEKRKRSQSQASPPKTEGGRGPSKRQKDGDEFVPRFQSPSPIQSASGFDDPMFQATQIAPVPTQIIDTGDAMDDSTEGMEPWDALASPTPSLIGDDDAHGSPVPSEARQLSLPPVVFVAATPSVDSSATNHGSPRAHVLPTSPTSPTITSEERGDLAQSPHADPARHMDHRSTTPAFAGDDCELWLNKLTGA